MDDLKARLDRLRAEASLYPATRSRDVFMHTDPIMDAIERGDLITRAEANAMVREALEEVASQILGMVYGPPTCHGEKFADGFADGCTHSREMILKLIAKYGETG